VKIKRFRRFIGFLKAHLLGIEHWGGGSSTFCKGHCFILRDIRKGVQFLRFKGFSFSRIKAYIRSIIPLKLNFLTLVVRLEDLSESMVFTKLLRVML
jgi:hypothetical protein